VLSIEEIARPAEFLKPPAGPIERAAAARSAPPRPARHPGIIVCNDLAARSVQGPHRKLQSKKSASIPVRPATRNKIRGAESALQLTSLVVAL